MIATMTLKENGIDIILVAPYSAAFVEDLKHRIPFGGRNWMKKDRVWLVHKDFAQEAKELCMKHFKGVAPDKGCFELLEKLKEDEFVVEEEDGL